MRTETQFSQSGQRLGVLTINDFKHVVTFQPAGQDKRLAGRTWSEAGKARRAIRRHYARRQA